MECYKSEIDRRNRMLSVFSQESLGLGKPYLKYPSREWGGLYIRQL